MALVSLRAYARHRGVNLNAVQKAIKSGRITTVGGKIDIESADKQWQSNTDPSPRGGKAQETAPPPAAPPVAKRKSRKESPPEPEPDDSPAEETPVEELDAADDLKPPGPKPPQTPKSFNEEKMWETFYNRKLKAQQLAKQKKELVPAAQVEKDWFNFCRTIRDNLLGIPSRLSAVLASDSDPHSVHRRLTEEIESVLADLSRE